jgi:hypothetical protein
LVLFSPFLTKSQFFQQSIFFSTSTSNTNNTNININIMGQHGVVAGGNF